MHRSVPRPARGVQKQVQQQQLWHVLPAAGPRYLGACLINEGCDSELPCISTTELLQRSPKHRPRNMEVGCHWVILFCQGQSSWHVCSVLLWLAWFHQKQKRCYISGPASWTVYSCLAPLRLALKWVQNSRVCPRGFTWDIWMESSCMQEETEKPKKLADEIPVWGKRNCWLKPGSISKFVFKRWVVVFLFSLFLKNKNKKLKGANPKSFKRQRFALKMSKQKVWVALFFNLQQFI